MENRCHHVNWCFWEGKDSLWISRPSDLFLCVPARSCSHCLVFGACCLTSRNSFKIVSVGLGPWLSIFLGLGPLLYDLQKFVLKYRWHPRERKGRSCLKPWYSGRGPRKSSTESVRNAESRVHWIKTCVLTGSEVIPEYLPAWPEIGAVWHFGGGLPWPEHFRGGSVPDCMSISEACCLPEFSLVTTTGNRITSLCLSG